MTSLFSKEKKNQDVSIIVCFDCGVVQAACTINFVYKQKHVQNIVGIALDFGSFGSDNDLTTKVNETITTLFSKMYHLIDLVIVEEQNDLEDIKKADEYKNNKKVSDGERRINRQLQKQSVIITSWFQTRGVYTYIMPGSMKYKNAYVRTNYCKEYLKLYKNRKQVARNLFNTAGLRFRDASFPLKLYDDIGDTLLMLMSWLEKDTR